MARATSSLPVPVSPVISTVVSVAATLSTSASVSRSAFEEPMISSNIERSSISWRSARFSAWSWPLSRAISSKARALATAAAIGRASASKTSTSWGGKGPGVAAGEGERADEPVAHPEGDADVGADAGREQARVLGEARPLRQVGRRSRPGRPAADVLRAVPASGRPPGGFGMHLSAGEAHPALQDVGEGVPLPPLDAADVDGMGDQLVAVDRGHRQGIDVDRGLQPLDHRLQHGGDLDLRVGGLGDLEEEPVLLLGRQHAAPCLTGAACPVSLAKPSLNCGIQFFGTEKPCPTLWSQTSSPFFTFLR